MPQFQGWPSILLENQHFYEAWWFEPFIASASFAFWVNLYWFFERQQGTSRNNNFWQEVRFSSGDLNTSLTAYWVGIYAIKCFASDKPIPNGFPYDFKSAVAVLCEVVVGIFFYDFLFFCIHLAMHQHPILWKIHQRHHNHIGSTLEARDVMRHSLVDGFLQVLCNIVAQQYNIWGNPKSRIARILHNIIVTWMLTESHTSSPFPNVWRRWCVGVRDHRLHHFGKSRRMQQFFGYLDNFYHMRIERHRSKQHESS